MYWVHCTEAKMDNYELVHSLSNTEIQCSLFSQNTIYLDPMREFQFQIWGESDFRGIYKHHKDCSEQSDVQYMCPCSLYFFF